MKQISFFKRKKVWGKTVPSILMGFFVVFFLGMFLGCIAGSYAKQGIYAPLLSFYQSMCTQLKTLSIDRGAVFFMAVKKQGKLFLLLWFFSITNIWTYFFYGFTFYVGVRNGLLLAFCTIMHGMAGVLHYFAFIFPQCLFYIPAFLLSVYYCNHTYQCLFTKSAPIYSGGEKGLKKRQLFVHQLPWFFVTLLLLLIGCFLEGFCNVPLLRYVLSK